MQVIENSIQHINISSEIRGGGGGGGKWEWGDVNIVKECNTTEVNVFTETKGVALYIHM